MFARIALAALLFPLAAVAAPVPKGAGRVPADPSAQAVLGVEVENAVVMGPGEDVSIGQRVTRVVPGTAAWRHRLAPGDLIIKCGSERVITLYTLRAALAHYRPGATVAVVVIRNDKTITIPVRLGDTLPESAPTPLWTPPEVEP